MKLSKKGVLIFFAILFLPACALAINWETLDYPGASATYPQGISGKNIVGYYTDVSQASHAFFYDGTTWTNLDYLGANNTRINVIDGDNYAGTYWNNLSLDQRGLWYNGTNLVTFQVPGDRLNIGGLSNGIIAGNYRNGPTGNTCFLYDGTTWTEIIVPLGTWAYINGIDGSNLVGTYSNSQHGFFYDGTTWTTLDVPGMIGTTPMDIDGGNIVGYFLDNSVTKGFLYNGTNWSVIEIPGAIDTRVTGIDESTLVGYYMDDSYATHGFSLIIPEPATVLLLLTGVTVLRKFRG